MKSTIEKKPLISIIVPIYNSELYLTRCLNSLLNQSYTNIEVILINDGSTDQSTQICQQYQNKYKNIVYIEKENSGVSDTRNLGLKNAKGKFICFVDSDDEIEINFIETLVNQFTPDKIAVNASIKKVGHYKIKDLCKNDTLSIYDFINDFVFNMSPLYCWGWLLRGDVAKKIEFDANIGFMEDSLYLIKYFSSFIDGTIKRTDEVFYYYYENPNSIVNNSDNIIRNLNFAILAINKLIEVCSHTEKTAEYENKLRIRLLILADKIIRNIQFKEYDKIFNNLNLTNELKKINKKDINLRYKIFINALLSKNKVLLFIYLKIRGMIKTIKKIIMKG